jgi:hypothetical protein
MAQPISISEILSARGDADNAGGGGALLPASNGAAFIQQAATARAAFNNEVAKNHETRLNEAIAAVKAMDYKKSFSADLPAIGQEYAAALKDISDNYDVISEPTRNIQKFGEFQSRLGNLQSKINVSTAHNAAYNENQKFLAEHPDWNTAENQEKMKRFAETPMSDRKEFLLTPPVSFDPVSFAKAAMASTKKVTSKEYLSKDKHYFVNEKGEYTDPNEYVKNYTTLLGSTMVNGRTGMDNFRDLYNKIPADENGKKPSFDQVLRQTALANLDKDTKTVSMQANQVALAQDRIAQDERESKRQTALGYARLAMEGKALKANEIKPEDGADAKYMAIYDVLHGDGLNQEYGQNIYGSDPAQAIKFQTGGVPVPKYDENNKIIGMETPPLVQQSVPKVQFLEAKPVAGHRIEIRLRENSQDPKTGELVSKDITRTESYDKMKSSFNRIYGNKFVTQIASGTSAFNRKTFKSTNPTVDDLVKRYRQEPVAQSANPKAPATQTKEKDPLGLF